MPMPVRHWCLLHVTATFPRTKQTVKTLTSAPAPPPALTNVWPVSFSTIFAFSLSSTAICDLEKYCCKQLFMLYTYRKYWLTVGHVRTRRCYTGCLVTLWTCFEGLFLESRQSYITTWTFVSKVSIYRLSICMCVLKITIHSSKTIYNTEITFLAVLMMTTQC